MTAKKASVVVLVVVGVVGLLATWSTLQAQGDTRAAQAAREVTLEGRIVDLHCFMTGQQPSTDTVKCTADCIRAGVPAALETSTGLFVLGQGAGGAVKTLVPMAYQEVEAHGKLYEKDGVKYLDIITIEMIEDEGADEESED